MNKKPPICNDPCQAYLCGLSKAALVDCVTTLLRRINGVGSVSEASAIGDLEPILTRRGDNAKPKRGPSGGGGPVVPRCKLSGKVWLARVVWGARRKAWVMFNEQAILKGAFGASSQHVSRRWFAKYGPIGQLVECGTEFTPAELAATIAEIQKDA